MLQKFLLIIYVNSTVSLEVRAELKQAGLRDIKEPSAVPEHLHAFSGHLDALLGVCRLWAHRVLRCHAQCQSPLFHRFGACSAHLDLSQQPVLRVTPDTHSNPPADNVPLVGCMFGLVGDALRAIAVPPSALQERQRFQKLRLWL